MPPFKILNIVLVVVVSILAVGCYYLNLSYWWLVVPLILHLTIFFFGAVNIRWNFYLTSLHKGSKTKQISLTFDDGPAEYTEAILDTLKLHNVKATFFTIGKRAEQSPDVVKRWHNEGHIIGNHSYDHGFNFDWKSSNAMAAEIEHCNQVINNITGRVPNLFRPPYGITNPNVGRAVAKAKVISIGWSIRSFDTKTHNEDELLNRILRKLTGGDIILLHDSMHITSKLLTRLIEQAKQKGYTFVPVNELLSVEAYK